MKMPVHTVAKRSTVWAEFLPFQIPWSLLSTVKNKIFLYLIFFSLIKFLKHNHFIHQQQDQQQDRQQLTQI